MPLTSTVPGAVAALQTHMGNAVAANPSLAAEVHLGFPTAEVANNYLQIGDETGALLVNYRQEFLDFPITAGIGHRTEEYGLLCSMRVWRGDTDPLGRLTDAFTLLNAVMAELATDPGGSGALTPSGTWHVGEVTVPWTGLLKNMGWGVELGFTVEIINVRLSA